MGIGKNIELYMYIAGTLISGAFGSLAYHSSIQSYSELTQEIGYHKSSWEQRIKTLESKGSYDFALFNPETREKLGITMGGSKTTKDKKEIASLEQKLSKLYTLQKRITSEDLFTRYISSPISCFNYEGPEIYSGHQRSMHNYGNNQMASYGFFGICIIFGFIGFYKFGSSQINSFTESEKDYSNKDDGDKVQNNASNFETVSKKEILEKARQEQELERRKKLFGQKKLDIISKVKNWKVRNK
jgi:hypothetical protein